MTYHNFLYVIIFTNVYQKNPKRYMSEVEFNKAKKYREDVIHSEKFKFCFGIPKLIISINKRKNIFSGHIRE